MSSNTHPVYEFGEFTLDPGRRSLTGTNWHPVVLAGKAFEALADLVAHAGQLVTRSALLDELWPSLVVEESNLNEVISAVRRAVGEGCITTVARRGYQFVAAVRTVAAMPVATNATTLAEVDELTRDVELSLR